MNRRSVHAAALLLAVCCACARTRADAAEAAAGAPRPAAASPQSADTVWQVSPFAVLLRGGFDGVVTTGQLLQHGSLGVGAADALDGEIAVMDGNVYQFMPGGVVVRPGPSLPIPFAIVTPWAGGESIRLPRGLEFTAPLLPSIDSRLPTTDAFYALRLTGTWSTVRARTFKKQSRPYGPITPEAEDRYTLTDVTGTMVGFREPSYVDSLSVPSWHLHFVTGDGRRGGHVLGFTANEVVLSWSPRPYFTVYVPPRVPAIPPP